MEYTNVIMPQGSPMENPLPYTVGKGKEYYKASELKSFNKVAVEAIFALKASAEWAKTILSEHMQKELQHRFVGRQFQPPICKPGMPLTLSTRC